MIGLPARLISAKAVLYLALALTVSLGVNGWLAWRLAGSSARCTASIAVDANKGLSEAREQEVERDQTSAEITRDTDTRADEALADAREDTQTAQDEIANDYRKHPTAPDRGAPVAVCRPDPVAGLHERFDEARARANAAAR